MLELLDGGGGFALGVLGSGSLAVAALQAGFLQVFLQAAGLGVAHGFIEAAVQQGVVPFGLLADAAHVFEQLAHFTALLLDFPRHLAAIEHFFQGGGALAGVGRLLIFERLADLLLLLGHLARLLAELAHFLAEAFGGLLFEVLLHLLQLALGTGGGVCGIGELLLAQFLGGVHHLLAHLVKLLARLGHVGGVLGLLHALFEVVEVAQKLLLLLLQPLELVLQFLALLLGLGLCDLVFQLLHLLRQRLLAAGEFLEPVEHLQVFLLLGALLLGGHFFLLVTLLLLFQLQAAELVFVRPLALPRLARLVLAHDEVLAAAGAVQPLERALLKAQRLIQGGAFLFLGGLLERIKRVLHALPCLGEREFHLGVLGLLHRLFGLVQSDALGLMHHIHIRRGGVHALAGVRVANDAPGGVDHLLLEIEQLVALRLLAGLAGHGGRGLALAEDVLKMAHVGKEHVAHGAAHLALRALVLGPEEITDELARLGVFFLQSEQGLHVLLLRGRGGGVLEEHFLAVARNAKGHTTAGDSDVIRHLCLHGQLLDGGDLDVPLRKDDLDLGELVRLHGDGEPGRVFVRALLLIHEMQPPFLRLLRLHHGGEHGGFSGFGFERQHGFVLAEKLGVLHRLVDGDAELDFAAFEHGGLHRVFDLLRRQAAVSRRGDFHIRAHQGRMDKGGDLVRLRHRLARLHAV